MGIKIFKRLYEMQKKIEIEKKSHIKYNQFN